MRALIIILFLSPFFSFAQESIERGDVYYDFFQYKEAIQEYEYALANNRTYKNEAHILTQLSYCYMYTFQYEKAEKNFAELIKLGDSKQTPDIYLDYGNILKILGKYGKAKEQFTYYKQLVKKDEYVNMLTRSLAWAEKHKDSVRTRTYIALTNLDISGQSLGYCFYMDGLIYAKAKDTVYDDYTSLYDLDFVYMQDSLTFVKGDAYVDDIKFPFNEGSPSVTHDGEVIYFTATAARLKKGAVKKVGGTQISEDGVSNLQLYSARFNNGKFGHVQEFPFNNKEYNYTHPSISKDGTTLYFVSDMPGGFGGLDIYKSVRQSNGTWGEPVNLGDKINTSENETYPYISNGYLYFSSKGHVGFGGYDLFQSTLSKNVPSSPRNMGKPFNSSKDDVAFIIAENGVSGYFSSNRDNTNGFDKVYYFYDGIQQSEPVAVALTDKPDDHQKVTLADIHSNKNPDTIKTKSEVSSLPITTGKKLSTVLFAFNSSVVEQAFYQSIDSAVNVVKANKSIKLNIHSHADCRGSDLYNMALAKRRSYAIKSYLINKGIPASRIGMISYGESQPIISCEPCEACTEEQHRINRRVEIRVGKF